MALTPDQENELARQAQHAFPLDPRPYDTLAAAIGGSAADVHRRLRAWQDEGLLREVSAILEGSALGYDSALVAGKVPARRLDRVAEIINQHPTVTHNYQRNHGYNLWFTIAVPKSMGIEASLEALAKATDVAEYLPLRRTRTFKIGVNFDLRSRRSKTEKRELTEAGVVSVGAREANMFRTLQTPLPLVERPFDPLAAAADVSVEELLAFAREHQGGAMRRFVATFHHRKLGVRGNGMAVWNVPEADHERVGQLLAAAPEVSHCYARNPVEGFPYTVYSMIHGPDEGAVGDIVGRLRDETGVADVLILFSSREFKKCRLRYFLPELDAWWDAHRPRAAA